MPSIVINEIDETSAGTASIVNDVAYVPGFSDKESFVTLTTPQTGVSSAHYIKFIMDEEPETFVPQLRIYQYQPKVSDYFEVVQSDDTKFTVTVTAFSESVGTSLTTGTYSYTVKVGESTTTVQNQQVKKDNGSPSYEMVPFDVVGLTSIESVTYLGNFSIYVQNGENFPSTAEKYARVAINGDFFYNKSQDDLYVASYAPNKGSVIEIEGTASVTVSSGSGTVNVGDITVDSVEGATSFSQENDTLTINASEDGTVSITVTGTKVSAGGLVDVSTPTTSVGIGGLTVGATGKVTVDGDTVLYTVADNKVTFSELFWNYIEPTDKNYTVTYVPENTPTYCSTKAQFESLFGEFPYKFKTEQKYDDMFATVATPDSPMFRVGDPDPSYVYAKELICAGIPVYYDNVVKREADGSHGAITVESMYEHIGNEFAKLQDPNQFNVKYITSGGYPTFEYTGGNTSQSQFNLSASMMKVATQGGISPNKPAKDEVVNVGRGDVIAFIDHTNNPQRALSGNGSVWQSLSGDNLAEPTTSDTAIKYWENNAVVDNALQYTSYGAMFTPWFKYTTKYTDNYVQSGNKKVSTGKFVIKMPASFAYLMDLANSIKQFPSWLAIAGVNRGQVMNYTGRTTSEVLTNKIAQNYQYRQDTTSMNPITEIRPYGQCIWGNRTLKPHEDGLTATCFLNIRNLVCDVKKTVYRAAKRCLFEQDTEVLWINFKSQITPILDQMVTGQGISAYKIQRVPTKEKAKMEAKVILYPIYAIEDIEVTVVMKDEEVSVTSNQ